MKIDLPVDLLYELFKDNSSNVRLKSIINKTFIDKGLKIVDYTDIKSFNDVCDKLGLLESDIIKSDYNKKLTAYIKLTTIIKALNGDWIPDFNNYNQYKYFNWFKINETGEFVFDVTGWDYGDMLIPSALYLKSYELAKYVAIIAEKEYKEFYLNMCI